MRGAAVVYRGELVKLASQARVWAALVLCAAGPWLFVGILSAQSAIPSDTLFGRHVHESGFAAPLVVLGFVGQWAIPLLTALVAGDIFAAEYHHGTWGTILTRSRSRGEFVVAKSAAAVTWTLVVVVLLGVSSLAAGVVLVGHQPLIDLSGTLIPAGRATVLVLASWATAIVPALAFTALGLLLSVASRRSAVGIGGPLVIGLVLQLLSLVNGIDPVRHLLLSAALADWHGLWTQPSFSGPLVVGLVASAVQGAVLVVAVGLVVRRRDVRGA